MQKIAAAALIMFALSINASAADELTWPKVFIMINDRFPNTPEKKVADLKLLQTGNASFYLFDVRKKKEFQVSRIKSALNLTSTEAIRKMVPKKDALIIVYCSVGYRSAAAVKNLRANGYGNSFNLKGGIFEWVNSGYKVYQNGKETSKVHPFNKKWGVLLQKQYRYETKFFWW